MTAANPLSRFFGWTDDRVAKLQELRASGLSSSQIATEFYHLYHANLTRNAILGKCHRMDISTPRARGHTNKPRRPLKPKKNLTNGLKKLRESLEVEFEASEARDLPSDESPNAVTFAELAEHHCRWPLADGHYCGDGRHEVDDRWGHRTLPYCARHCRVAYRRTIQLQRETKAW